MIKDGRGVNLAVPEFEGLWDQHKPYTVPKDIDGPRKIPGATKMEMVISASSLRPDLFLCGNGVRVVSLENAAPIFKNFWT